MQPCRRRMQLLQRHAISHAFLHVPHRRQSKLQQDVITSCTRHHCLEDATSCCPPPCRLSAVSETHSRSVHINRGSRINDHFLLQRSTTSLALEAQLDGGGLLGACQAGGVPRLAGLPERACKPLLCLWSTMQNANVDLWLHTLSGIHDAALKSKCPTPLGGQTPVEPGQVPEVSCSLPHQAIHALAKLGGVVWHNRAWLEPSVTGCQPAACNTGICNVLVHHCDLQLPAARE